MIDELLCRDTVGGVKKFIPSKVVAGLSALLIGFAIGATDVLVNVVPHGAGAK